MEIAELFNIPTIANIQILFQKYDQNVMLMGNIKRTSLREESVFLDKILSTTVMKTAMAYLKYKG